MNSEDKKTILLVEDEVIVALAEKMELVKYGYTVHHITTGKEAIKIIYENIFTIDLILMDINLGAGIDGTQTAEEILNHKNIPIVFLSSHTEPKIVEKTEKITSYGYVVKNSGIIVLNASIKMAFKLFNANNKLSNELAKQKQMEDSIREQRDFSESLIETAQIIILVLDTQGRIVRFNPYMENLVGYGLDEVKGMNWFETFIQPEQEHTVKSVFQKALNDTKTRGNINPIIAKDGRVILVEWFDKTLKDKNGRAAGILAIGIDITERKRAEAALRRNEKDLRESQRISHVGSWRLDLSTNQVVWTEELYNMYGFDPSLPPPPYTEHMKLFTPESWERLSKALARTMETGIPYTLELETRRKDGSNGWMWVRGEAAVDSAGKTVEVWGAAQDITERKRSEQEILKQLAEKEILLREVHHRMKNNIANIEGLLLLQINSITNPEAKAALKDTLSRVQSMRVLYDKLLLSKDYHEISIKSYIESLISSFVMVYDAGKNIVIDKRLADFTITAKKVISVGIIINELLTNVFKYAFKDRDKGNVSVSIDKKENTVTIIIQDNGIGIDERILRNESPGFGLTIVKMLIEQLNGTYSIVNENGTKSVIQFEISDISNFHS